MPDAKRNNTSPVREKQKVPAKSRWAETDKKKKKPEPNSDGNK